MPEKPLSIAAYAAGASLAAITLVYVFQPTFFIDGESAGSSASSRKRGIVGLSNPANDCFINSVLQALAGLGDLRIYLIRETHRRDLDGQAVYKTLVENPARKNLPAWKIEGLQAGIVTQGLKNILDALNERPIYKKTISAAGFVAVLEQAFKQRISRQQQDAQEFLQVVAERLCDEYHAGSRAREHARKTSINGRVPTRAIDQLDEDLLSHSEMEDSASEESSLAESPSQANVAVVVSPGANDAEDRDNEEPEDGFPLEGASESQIECLTCKFKPKPTGSTFCTLSLSVPQVSSTTLNACFDGMFKTEYIEDFKCEKCRLVHALGTFKEELVKSNSEKFRAKTAFIVEKLEEAIATDPEQELSDVVLPDKRFAPKRKIARHIRVTKFPKILAIHLSRSIFDRGSSSMKNSAKVAFPERLRLGGLLDQKMYRLSSVVCHKGSHHSGHYESFRRQNISPPFSTPNTFHTSGVYSKTATPIPSQISTPQFRPISRPDLEVSTLSSTPEILSPTSQSSISLPTAGGNGRASYESNINLNGSSRKHSESNPNSALPNAATRPNGMASVSSSRSPDADTSSLRSFARSAKSSLSRVPSIRRSSPPSSNGTGTATSTTTPKEPPPPSKKKKKATDSRWWRISDDKVKECKTGDVLGMQKEVYMLFYELEKDDDIT